MSTLGVQNPTLLDLAKITDPDGNIATVVEILNQVNEVLTDMSWVEGNLPTGHRTTIRAGLPTPTWRKLYGGVQPSKGTTVQVTDNTAMLEAYAEIDKALADLNGNTAAWRLSEDRAHIEGMSQEAASKLFYGNEGSAPETFTGLAARYASTTAPNGANVIPAVKTSGNQGSIWLVVWGPNTVHGIIPKGSKAGLQVEDKGQVTLETAVGGSGRMEAYRTHYRWDQGLTLRDWRYVVRICNIDRTSLVTDPGASDDNLPELMFQAEERVPNISAGRAVWYMDRHILTKLRQQSAKAVKNSTLTVDMVGGVKVTAFDGIPIRRVDALYTDEANIS